MTDREFAEGIAVLCAAVGKEMTADQMRAWKVMFEDLTAEQFKDGIVKTIRSYTFAGFPPIGVIRDNCGAKSGIIATKDRPTLAWGDVRRAISRVGGYDSPKFDDPIIHATIRQLGGWVALCDSTADELVWREKDFLRTYAALSPLNLPDEQIERLTGIAERENGPALPVKLVEVGCLTAGSHGERRIVEEPKIARISESGPAADLAKRLTFDDRDETEPTTPIITRTRDEQVAALRSTKRG
jgi:hypothetical protein